MNKTIKLAIASAAALLVLSGCGQAPWEDSLRDLENVPVKDPDSATLYNNVDKYPNISRLCIDGVAFATTTRPDFGALMRVPEWDAECP